MTEESCSRTFCPTCEEEQDVERIEGREEEVMCLACGDEFTPEKKQSGNSIYQNFVVGLVLEVEPLPKKSDLKKCLIDVNGGETEGVVVVTNAKHISAGWRVIVALENAVVPAGSDPEEDTNVTIVKKSVVGGVKSEGMICDAPMLAWSGGAKGVVQQIPEEFCIGGPPPSSRPLPKMT